MASVTMTHTTTDVAKDWSLEPADGREAPTSADSTADESVRALTDAVVAGDRDAYTQLYCSRCEFVEREAARRLGRRRDLASDAAQEVWMRVARSPRRSENSNQLDAWLKRVVQSAVIDLLRNELSRRLREEAIAESRHEAQEFVADVELLEAMRHDLQGLGALSSDERSMLELRARTSVTLSQFASIFGLGRASIDSRLRRAAALARKSSEGVLP
ncbi:MAG: sigma-70 family RNA polymerase sigma factor [Phycisphaerae bacterium]|nr:sigma-70 family RNA polymerase sigma factor [Phycisphaerae bacterium]